MELRSLLFSLSVMMICQLGAVRCSRGDEVSCPCPAVPPRNLTEPPTKTCHSINEKFRYQCIGGYVRKAGTSNLITCKKTDGAVKWIYKPEVLLQCIPDPKIIPPPPPPPPPLPTTPKGLSEIPLDPIITTTVTAASTSLPMTQSVSTSPSVAAETDITEPTSPGLQVPTDHTQASSTSPQMTPSVSTSPSVAAETDITESTSPGPQVPTNHTQDETAVAAGVNQTMKGTSSSSTTEPPNRTPTRQESSLGAKTATGITIGSLVIICAGIGLCFYCYRRRSKFNTSRRRKSDGAAMTEVRSLTHTHPEAAADETSSLTRAQDITSIS